MRYLFSLFLLSLCFQFLSAQKPVFQDFDAYIQNGLKQWNIPGLSVAVVHKDEVVFAKGYGSSDLQNKKPVNEHTIFGVGSNTKAFTATALSWLQYERRLYLDNKIRQYLPDFQMEDTLAAREMTIRDVLCHRIGTATWSGDFTHWGSKYSRKELIQKMRYIPAANSFRTRFGYTNVGYMLVGELIPIALGGQTWEELMKTRFLKPLKMERTSLSVEDLSGFSNVATPHTLYRNEQLISVPWRNIDEIAACGGMYSSAADMANWLMAQMDSGRLEGRAVIPWKVIQETHLPHICLPAPPYRSPLFPSTHFQAYGLGWFLKDYQGRMLVYHGGAIDGMLSLSVMLPEEKYGFVILTNSDSHQFIYALMYQLLDHFCKAPYKDWNAHFYREYSEHQAEIARTFDDQKNINNFPSLNPKQYAGYYFHPHYGQIAIRYENGQLKAYPSAHPEIVGKLLNWNGDLFVCEWTDKVWDRSTMRFEVEAGKAVRFDMLTRPDFLDPSPYMFERVE